LSGLYVNDLWQINEKLRLNLGLRWDILTGFTRSNQVDPTINLIYSPTSEPAVHGGFAHYMRVPSFQGNSPTASEAFPGTTAAGPAGSRHRGLRRRAQFLSFYRNFEKQALSGPCLPGLGPRAVDVKTRRRERSLSNRVEIAREYR
jgi:outer membrane receptor protein involved in Fe transport